MLWPQLAEEVFTFACCFWRSWSRPWPSTQCWFAWRRWRCGCRAPWPGSVWSTKSRLSRREGWRSRLFVLCGVQTGCLNKVIGRGCVIVLSSFRIRKRDLSSDSTHVQSKQDRIQVMCCKTLFKRSWSNITELVNVLPPCVERGLGAIAVGHQEVGIVVQDKVFSYMPRRVNDWECRTVEVEDSYDCFLSQTRGLGRAMEEVVQPAKKVCTLIFRLLWSGKSRTWECWPWRYNQKHT